MKNFTKTIKTLALVFVIMFASFAVIACSNSKSKSATPAATTISDTDEIKEEQNQEISDKNENDDVIVEDTQENTEPEITVDSLNGVYEVTKTITFDDADRSNAEEVIEFFKTRDFNGVHHVIDKLGFKNYSPFTYNEETDTATQELLWIKNKALVKVSLTDGVYAFSKEEGVDISSIIKKIEFNKDTNTYIFHTAFVYTDTATSNFVISPLTFKIPVKQVAFSNTILDGNEYVYKTNSAIVKIDNNDILTQEVYESKLAEIFEFESVENVFEEITNTLSSYKYIISNDSSRLTVLYETNDTDYFAFCNLSENRFYNIAGFNVRLENHTFNLETKKDEYTLSISIQNETRLLVKLISK